MSVFLSNGTFIDSFDDDSPGFYSSAPSATWIAWFQAADNQQTLGGIFSLVNRSPALFENRFGIGYDYVAPILPGRLTTEIYCSGTGRSYWQKNATIAANALTMVGLSYNGAAAATQAARHRSYLNGIEDTANGVFSGVVPAANIGALPQFTSLNVGNRWDDVTLSSQTYAGCVCCVASWRDIAATPAQMLELFGLGPPGNLSLSTLGTPANWLRFDDSGGLGLLDEGTNPFLFVPSWEGPGPYQFGCPSGDPLCGPSIVLVSPEDADFYAKIRRRR